MTLPRLDPYRNINLGVTGQVVKAGPGMLFALIVTNDHATDIRFIKIYNKATAPTEADTPVFTFGCPAQQSIPWPAIPNGVVFSAGISLRATTAVADNDTGAPDANDVIVSAAYK